MCLSGGTIYIRSDGSDGSERSILEGQQLGALEALFLSSESCWTHFCVTWLTCWVDLMFTSTQDQMWSPSLLLRGSSTSIEPVTTYALESKGSSVLETHASLKASHASESVAR